MKIQIKLIALIMFAILLISSASAEVIINSQPDKIYNSGDMVSVATTIKSSSDISGSFEMDLLCSNYQINFYKNGISLAAGEEKKVESSLMLSHEMTEGLKRKCKIKAVLNEEYALTNEFEISDLIEIAVASEKLQFNPGEEILVAGEAAKENSKAVNGFIDINIIGDQTLNQLGTIANGFFEINISLPKDLKSGDYKVSLYAYEKNSNGDVINSGNSEYGIAVRQLPTSLEILLETAEVEPGTNLKLKTILHDQAGDSIDASAIITIKNNDNAILEQTEKSTNEFLEYPIKYNEPVSEWTIFAVSNKLTSEANFLIKEKKEIKIEIANETLILTNTGNVLYDNTLLVKIGNNSLNINASVQIDESKTYLLTAPQGEYLVEVINNGEKKISENIVLTGKTIDIKETSDTLLIAGRYPLVWIFIIGILGFISYLFFKKGYKKSFIGYIHKKKNAPKLKEPVKPAHSIINSNNRAQMSLSIKGQKQNAGVVCLKIKNFKDIEAQNGNTKETLQKIVDFAEKRKAATYENQDNLYFILAPTKTRSFKNEKTAIEIAKEIKKILDNDNKLFKQKIEFGISINYGEIIAKNEINGLKFMALSQTVTAAKKTASLSSGEIYLSEKFRAKALNEVKSEKHEIQGASVYTIKEIKHQTDNKKFLSDFVRRNS